MKPLSRTRELLYVALVSALLVAALYICFLAGQRKVDHYRTPPTTQQQGARQ